MPYHFIHPTEIYMMSHDNVEFLGLKLPSWIFFYHLDLQNGDEDQKSSMSHIPFIFALCFNFKHTFLPWYSQQQFSSCSAAVWT